MAKKGKTKKAKSAPSQPKQAMVVHGKSGQGEHIVGVGNLRVLLTEDKESGYWFAQGLEIDYFAEAPTESDAKDRFSSGLIAMISEHLRVFGAIEKLLVPAPKDVWIEFFNSPKCAVLSTVSFHEIPVAQSPNTARFFEGIQFFKLAA